VRLRTSRSGRTSSSHRILGNSARARGRVCRRTRLRRTDPGCNRAAPRLRRKHRPCRAWLGLRGGGRGARAAAAIGCDAEGPAGPRSRLRVAELRSPSFLDGGTPPSPLGAWRRDGPFQPRAALPSPSLADSRRRLAACSGARRRPRHHPAHSRISPVSSSAGSLCSGVMLGSSWYEIGAGWGRTGLLRCRTRPIGPKSVNSLAS
jgi:hypothetical protein